MKTVNIAPIALSNAAANLLNCGVTSLAGPVGLTIGQPYLLITHIHFANNDASAPHNFTIFKGATGGSSASTALFETFPLTAAGTVGSTYDYYPGGDGLRLDSTDFLTGLADVANKIVLTIDADIGISG